MSYANLYNEIPAGGKIKIKGGLSQGHVKKTNQRISVEKYTPSFWKGSEYAVPIQERELKARIEAQQNNVPRTDVTENPGEGPSNLFQTEELTSIGTLPNVQELNREELTQVYQNYTFTTPTPSETLEPIYNEKTAILQLIKGNRTCIIEGPTGCGKSTQIPQFILDSYAQQRAHCNIVVTQPRRIAAISIAQRVSEERNWTLGELVGYQVALDKKISKDTRLLYCTTGVLLEKLIAAKNLNDYTHIILDEVHEREEDMDFLMLIAKKFQNTNSPNVKIVLMSATMEVSRFANYFDIQLPHKKEAAPAFKIQKHRKFVVNIFFLEDLESLLIDVPKFNVEEPGISPQMYKVVPHLIRAFNTIDAEDYAKKRCLEEKGAVLIFLPGLYQIETLYDELLQVKEKDPTNFNLWLCPLHSSITKDEQENVRRYAPHGMRKVILSTNIAESSITITDVKYVIDFCLTKHLVADQATGFSSLQMAWASHVNCIQREGRVGRVQDGRVYRLVPKSFYEYEMPKESVPEMQRCPLDVLVLKSKKLFEEECPIDLIALALDPPDLINYNKTIVKLKQVGAMMVTCKGEENEDDGDLTFMGRVMASLPLDIHITKLILLGHFFDVLEDAIRMGCAISVANVFSEPFQKRLEAYNNKLLWADVSESDVIAYLNAYNVWRHETGVGRFNGPVVTEESWGRKHMLQIKHLKEIAKQEAEIKNRLMSFNIQVVRERGRPLWKLNQKPLILKLILAGAFYPHYFSFNAQNPNAESEAVRMLSGHSPYNCVYLQNVPQPAPLYFDQIKDMFRKLNIFDNIIIHHDDTRKLVVQFGRKKEAMLKKFSNQELCSEIPGEIVMPVYRALKVRQLQVPLIIQTVKPYEVEKELKKLKTSRALTSVEPSDLNAVIPLDVVALEIEVCHIESPSHFFGQVLVDSYKLARVTAILNQRYVLRPVCGNIMVGDMIYAAPYQVDGVDIYYRAKVINQREIDRVLWVEVYFIDYGNKEKMTADALRDIYVSDEEQRELDCTPPLALECVLAEVCPSVWNDREGHWSKEAKDFVERMLFGKDSSSGAQVFENRWTVKVYSCVDGVASVFLYIRDQDKKGPLTLNELLIKKGFARYREESYFSKSNHNIREKVASEGYRHSSRRREEEKGGIGSLNLDLMSLPTSTEYSKNVYLKGPNSPLEMKLFSKMKSSTAKDVKVEWNSVNSVLLDADPADPHERILVAASISQSPDGRKLTLNHTTVLPNMHGLAALLCLMFSPSVELRTDDVRSRYTGALCGLGMSKSGSPLYHDLDMEIKFDVEFTPDDIVTVNKLRYWMNYRFCGDDAEDMSESQILNIHKNVQVLTLELLKKTRRSVKVYHYPDAYKWGGISNDYLISPYKQSEAVYFCKSIYKLINGVVIEPENDKLYITELVKKLSTLERDLSVGLTPKELQCPLCDIDFKYILELKDHLQCHHHKELLKWLVSRANAHKIRFTRV